jgi:hypothetical protein
MLASEADYQFSNNHRTNSVPFLIIEIINFLKIATRKIPRARRK